MDKPQPDLPRWAGWLVTVRWPLLAVAAALAVACFSVAPALTYDRSIQSMFAAGSPVLQDYEQLQRTFGGNEVVLLVYEQPDLWDERAEWIDRMAAVRRQVEQVPGVASVLSLDRLVEAAPGNRSRSLRALRSLFAGLTHGAEGTTVALICMLEGEIQQDERRAQAIARLAEIAEGLPRGAIAGEPVMITEGFRLVERDADRLTLYAGILLAATIWLCFRTLRWVIIPALVVQLSLLQTRATLVLLGVELTMVSSMLTAVVLVIAVATLMHVAVRHRQMLSQGHRPVAAVHHTIAQLGAPVFWTCLTDAAGFAALMTASVGPVRDFGLMLAIGSVAVLISTALLVPGLLLIGQRRVKPRSSPTAARLSQALAAIPDAIFPHRWKWLGIGATAAAVVSAGVIFLQIESDFTRNFRADSPLVQAYQRVEGQLGGAGVLDVVVPAPADLSWEYLQQVLRLEQQLRDQLGAAPPNGAAGAANADLAGAAQQTGRVPDSVNQHTGLTKVISLADAAVVLSPVNLNRMPRFVRGPALNTGLGLMRRELPDFYDALYGQDPLTGDYSMRLMLRTWERQPAEAKTELIARVEQIAREHFPEARVTGYFVLLSDLIRTLLADQWITFAVAMAAIVLMMVTAYQRLLWGVLALLPNVVPVLLVLGGMGWLSQVVAGVGRVNMGVAMIAAVSTGLSVDGSVHYLFSYRRHRRWGAGHLDALSAAHWEVGRSLGLATLSLVLGLLVLCTSSFMPTVYFGALASLAMVGGTAGNLIFLPLLLRADD